MRHLLCFAAWCAAAAAAVDSTRTYVQSTDYLLSARDVLDLPYISQEDYAPSVQRRQISPAPSGTGSSSLNLTPGDSSNSSTWDQTANAACMQALGGLTRSTNPSGDCLCYNLPSLDTKTGVFRSEIRVYRISEPRDGFAGVEPTNINVGVQYNGASVSPVSAADFNLKGSATSPRSSTSNPAKRQETNVPRLVQTYMFVGQIDPARMKEQPSMAQLQALVTPTFTLTAQTPNRGSVSTNLSLNEALFVTGAFSDQVVRSDFASAQAAVDRKIAAVQNGTVAFVLPGTQIMIFPVGAIITGIWVVLGITAYGYGTYERSMFANSYKQRQATRMEPRGKTI